MAQARSTMPPSQAVGSVSGLRWQRASKLEQLFIFTTSSS